MCGIMGMIGRLAKTEAVFQGLCQLEYRGYDSAGISTLSRAQAAGQAVMHRARAEGKLFALQPKLETLPAEPISAIGHTRWATHGVPSEANAHPHASERVAVVHNGIIENYKELRAECEQDGYVFTSQTDTEAIVALMDGYLRRGLPAAEALRSTLARLQGAFALAMQLVSQPETIFLARHGSPLVLGHHEDGVLFASDTLPLARYTQTFTFLEDGDVAELESSGQVRFFDVHGQSIDKLSLRLDMHAGSAEKQGYKHFMLKEIHEQPRTLAGMIERLVDPDSRQPRTEEGALSLDLLDLSKVERVLMTACGTAYQAACVGRYVLEPMLGMNVEVELASELRYRDPVLDERTLVVGISQSGETADTLACLAYAKDSGCQIYSVCNVKFSAIDRLSHATLLMELGPEIGVASTKAFTGMILGIYLFGLAWSQRLSRSSIGQSVRPAASLEDVFKQLKSLPPLVEQAMSLAPQIEEIGSHQFEGEHCLYVGRGVSFPLAMEGALKLKEISYIHAEGYAGGELKHGPIALVDIHMPVVALIPHDKHFDKMISNLEEIRAREGRLIAIGPKDNQKLSDLCEALIPCPQIDNPALQAILQAIPLQLLAYSVAVHRGTDVDQPRNLAKSVTVE